jgi:large subunit ribosomal protein L6
MSRVGKVPVPLPDGVEFSVGRDEVTVKGPKGELTQHVPTEVTIEKGASDEGAAQIVVTRPSNQPKHRAMHGLVRALLANMVEGVTNGYEKRLEIVGVGYRFVQSGSDVDLSAGFSHPVKLAPPAGITYNVIAPNQMSVIGIDKQLVGHCAAQIRRLRPPEPYKGKGIKYQGEYVRRKIGKRAQ